MLDLLNTTKETLSAIVEHSITKKEVLAKYGRRGCAGDYRVLNKLLEKYNIQISHFYSHGTNTYVSHKELFVKNCNHSQRVLRKKVLQDKVIPYKCAICGQEPEWNGKPLTLTLDHINGDNKDNRVKNLRFVCPNCDTQQNTYCSKNIKHKKALLDSRKEFCVICGKPVSNKGVKYCRECYDITRSAHIPSMNTLIKDFISLKSFTCIGHKYGISDNAVKKWFKRYKLPYKKKELNNYINGYLSEKSKEPDCKFGAT